MSAPRVDLAKVPPNCPDAEQSVLAAILARPERIEKAAKELSPTHFYDPIYRDIFQAMLALKEQERTIDQLTLKDVLSRNSNLEKAGGPVRLGEIAAGFVGNFIEAVQIVSEMSCRREVITAGYSIAEAAHDLGRDLSEAMNHAANAMRASKSRNRNPGRAFKFLPLSDFLETPRHTTWLARGYLEAGTIIILFGEAGCMKSFVAIDIGLCIASGKPWHGHAVPNPGPVFYLCGEGFPGISKRVKAWTVAHGVDNNAIPFFISNSPAQLLDADHAREVADAVEDLAEQHGQPQLVIVDTLNRNFGDGDENSSQDMTTFVAALDTLKARFGCAVMVVHHSGLGDNKRVRGSSVLRAAADFEYKLTVKGAFRVLSCTKCKDHDPPEDMPFEPEEVSTGWTDFETLQEVTSCVLRLPDMPQEERRPEVSGAKRIALDALRDACEAAGGPVCFDEWKRAAYANGVSKTGNANAQRQAFFKARKALQTENLVQEVGGFWSPSDGVTKRYSALPSNVGHGMPNITTVTPSLEGVTE